MLGVAVNSLLVRSGCAVNSPCKQMCVGVVGGLVDSMDYYVMIELADMGNTAWAALAEGKYSVNPFTR